ncbi:MAG: DUF5131 family protein [Armatimonadota bacterium]
MNPTKIEWCHVFGPGSGFTVNPVFGCTGPREGPCPYCYARERIAPRVGHLCGQYPDPNNPAHRHLDPERTLCEQFWPHPHWERLAAVEHRRKPAGIFVGSCCDLWDPNVDPRWRWRVWQTVEMCPQHVFWTLTKRPENLTASDRRVAARNPHLWLGVTVTSAHDSHRLCTMRKQLPRERWFVSYEPLLGPVDPRTICLADWIIVGAQTGAGARLPAAAWVHEIVTQARRYCIPVFVKDNLRAVWGDLVQQWPEAMTVCARRST